MSTTHRDLVLAMNAKFLKHGWADSNGGGISVRNLSRAAEDIAYQTSPAPDLTLLNPVARKSDLILQENITDDNVDICAPIVRQPFVNGANVLTHSHSRYSILAASRSEQHAIFNGLYSITHLCNPNKTNDGTVKMYEHGDELKIAIISGSENLNKIGTDSPFGSKKIGAMLVRGHGFYAWDSDIWRGIRAASIYEEIFKTDAALKSASNF